MSIAENIKRIREKYGITQQQLGEIAGVSDKAVSTWESGLNVPRMGAIQKMADHFGIAKSKIIDENGQDTIIPVGFEPLPKMKKVPLLGTIACGEPLMSLEDATCFYDVTESIHADFCLRCKGDSMINARILNGDIVFIHSQPDVENGEIAAVEIEGEATLKRVHKFCVGGHLRVLELRAENPNEPIRTYEGEQLRSVRIIGKAVAFTSHVR